MAKHQIGLKGIVTVECASPTLLRMDMMEAKERFVSIKENVSILPGDFCEVPIPMELREEKFISIEPNVSQTKAFF